MATAMADLEQATGVQRIPASEYHAIPALSNSGMKRLAISPLSYWFHEINPARVAAKESAEMTFGTALHCMVLEGEAEFYKRYAVGISQDDYPDTLLVKVDDLKGWLQERNCKTKSVRKDDLIRDVQAIDATVPIWDVLVEEDRRNNEGKIVLCKSEFQRLSNAADALLAEPRLRSILASGEPEVSLVSHDPISGTPLKARLDWVSDDFILDLKTFSQKRGKSIDQTIADAIFWEGYYRQAFLYTTMHQRITGRKKAARFVMAFVESDPPHEVRLREFRPTTDGVMNVYWSRAQLEVNSYCQLWMQYVRRFGEKPWREEQRIEVLLDEEMRALAFS